jgi:hypothetical protein
MSTTAADRPQNGSALVPTANNPFEERSLRPAQNAAAEALTQREIAEIQAAMVIAQRFPRNERDRMDAILNAFTRVELCEKAMYEYARGGTDISGLSIRAAEAIAQQWGNIQFGIRELEQRGGHSTVQSYAWDLQTNVREERQFHVEHVRSTKARTYRVEDPRDIYEMVANQGARRLRSCILAIIPIDVQRSVEKQVELTLTNKISVTPERVANLIEMLGEYGVSKRAIENLIQRSLESITPLQMLRLGRIYTALKDGVGSIGDYFEIEAPADATPGQSRADALAEKLKQKKAEAAAAAPADEEKVAPAETIDDKSVRAELRTKIAKLWEHLPLKKREAILKGEHPQNNSIVDLSTDQLIEFHDKLPELLAQGEEE